MSFSAEKRRALVSIGYCGWCGSKRGEGSTKSLCARCNQIRKASEARVLERMAESKAGARPCERCETCRAMTGFFYCRKCQEVVNKERRREAVSLYKKIGVCISCGEPWKDAAKSRNAVCPSCVERRSAS